MYATTRLRGLICNIHSIADTARRHDSVFAWRTCINLVGVPCGAKIPLPLDAEKGM